jgi:hypothetical protein
LEDVDYPSVDDAVAAAKKRSDSFIPKEQEEFEFRLRAEQEASAAPAAAPVSKAMAEQPFEKEARELIETTPAELISAHPLVRTATSAVRPILVGRGKLISALGDESGLENVRQLDKMQARGAKALGYDKGAPGFEALPAPTTMQDLTGTMLGPLGIGMAKVPLAKTVLGRVGQGTTIGAAAGATADPDKTFAPAAGGGALGGALTAAIEGVLRLPVGIGKLIDAGRRVFGGGVKDVTRGAPTTKGAERVVGELQRQRGVLEGKEPPRQGPAPYPSKAEEAMLELDYTTKPLREEALRSGARVQADDALKLIETLKSKNVDKGVIRALDEVAGEIKDAVSKSSAATLPAAGARMTAAELKQLQQGGGGMDMPMLDEVRQSINRMISAKGDKALDAYTQKLLAQVRDDLVGRAPPQYGEYLKKYAEGQRAIDPFREQGTPLQAATVEQGATIPAGMDAQRALEKVFAGGRPERDFTALVRDTGHSRQARQSLQEAFGKWVMPTDQGGLVNLTTAANHWNSVKGAVQTSGLLSPNHFKATDKVMTELARAKKASHASEQAATGVAWFLGLPFGRPGSTAMVARSAVGRLAGVEKTPGEIQAMIVKMMQDEQIARLAAALPTENNMAAFERALVGTSAAQAARPKQREKRTPIFSMRPQGL